MNVTDIHAGELYMLAEDPSQDRNVYSISAHSAMMRKMASLPDVSWLQKHTFPLIFFMTSVLCISVLIGRVCLSAKLQPNGMIV